MKRTAKLFLAGILALATMGESAWACNPICRPYGGGIQRTPPANVPPQQISPSPGDLSANDVIVNDLPVDAKRAIRAAAAKVRTNSAVRQPAQNVRFARTAR